MNPVANCSFGCLCVLLASSETLAGVLPDWSTDAAALLPDGLEVEGCGVAFTGNLVADTVTQDYEADLAPLQSVAILEGLVPPVCESLAVLVPVTPDVYHYNVSAIEDRSESGIDWLVVIEVEQHVEFEEFIPISAWDQFEGENADEQRDNSSIECSVTMEFSINPFWIGYGSRFDTQGHLERDIYLKECCAEPTNRTTRADARSQWRSVLNFLRTVSRRRLSGLSALARDVAFLRIRRGESIRLRRPKVYGPVKRLTDFATRRSQEVQSIALTSIHTPRLPCIQRSHKLTFQKQRGRFRQLGQCAI